MTTPYERTRNLIQAGAFLKALEEMEELPADVRYQATRLSRHYPTVGDIRHIAAQCATTGASILTVDFDPAWLETPPRRSP
jgi:hypothetical protein